MLMPFSFPNNNATIWRLTVDGAKRKKQWVIQDPKRVVELQITSIYSLLESFEALVFEMLVP